MKFKTKQDEIDWCRSEMKLYREELVEERDAKEEMKRRAEEYATAFRELNVHLREIRNWEGSAEEMPKLVEALVKNQKLYVALINTLRSRAQKNIEGIEAVISNLRFIGRCACSNSGSNYLDSDNINISVDRILLQVCDDLRGLLASDRGIVNGNQDRLMVDHVADLTHRIKSEQ